MMLSAASLQRRWLKASSASPDCTFLAQDLCMDLHPLVLQHQQCHNSWSDMLLPTP